MPKRWTLELPTYLLDDDELEALTKRMGDYLDDHDCEAFPCERAVTFIAQVKEELRYRRGTVELGKKGFKLTPATYN